MKYLHVISIAGWLLITPVALIFWQDSVLFVIICSLYANIYASVAAYQGSRTEEKESK
jgi:hypothetical protein